MVTGIQMSPAHHPIFDRFVRTPHKTGPQFVENFVGALTRTEFESDLPPDPAGRHMNFTVSGRALATDADPTLPAMLSEDYFEWIDMLESIDRARDQYVMVELGAGYGRWLVNAAAALRRHKSHPDLPARFIGVEASPVRFCWLAQNREDNRIDPAESKLVWGAVSNDEESGFFPIYHPHWAGNQGHTYGAPFERSDGTRFQRVQAETPLDKLFPNIEYHMSSTGDGQLFVRVQTFSLAHLIEDYSVVDLIDMDIQGAELDVVRSSLGELNRKVRRVHIATHGHDIEREIRALLAAEGWENVWDLPYDNTHPSPYGEMYFCDGIQGWINPALR
jgi:FkbM family methyltransferase